MALVLVNAMWGSSFPVMKCLNLQVDQHFGVTEFTASTWLRAGSAAWMIAIRFSLAFLAFAVCYWATVRRVRMPHLLAGAAIGAVFFAGILFQVMGLATIPASRSGFLTSLGVVFTPLISTLYRGRIPRLPVLLGVAVALAGVAILTGLVEIQSGRIRLAENALQRWTVGDSLTTLAALFFSGQILLVDGFGKRYESLAFTPSMFATVAVLGAIVFAVLRAQIPEIQAISSGPANGLGTTSSDVPGDWSVLATQPRFYLLMAWLCVVPSLIAFAWMNKYQPSVSAVQASVIYTLEPVFASLWAMLLPALLSLYCYVSYSNEQFSVPLVVGGALVLAANVLALWPERGVRRTPSSASVNV